MMKINEKLWKIVSKHVRQMKTFTIIYRKGGMQKKHNKNQAFLMIWWFAGFEIPLTILQKMFQKTIRKNDWTIIRKSFKN